MKPLAWMRRWAFDGVDVMALRKAERPAGWHFHAITPDKLLPDDVPLGAIEKLPQVLHLKRGSTYDVIGEGEVQISTGEGIWGNFRQLKEGDKLVVYRAQSDGKLWLRFPDEFNDGRFGFSK